MPGLTTHVLDTANGIPAKGVKIALFKINATERVRLREAVTNDDGRTDAPMLSADQCVPAPYELEFHIGDYFRDQGATSAGAAFLDVVPVRFVISEPDAHYHVPLLVSPFSYTTYRGS